MFQVRKIRPEDVQFVMELAKENNCFEGKLLSNIEGFLICENNNIKCGCGCLAMSGDKGYIGWLLVSEGSRRQRFGEAVIKALLNVADKNGIKDVYAEGICGDFLTAMGFEKINGTEQGMKEVLGLERPECYHVSLEGYFIPCSEK